MNLIDAEKKYVPYNSLKTIFICFLSRRRWFYSEN